MKKIFLLAILAFSLNGFSQVPPYVPTAGLLGWWPFNGNANDESVNGNNCTIFNGPVLCPDRFGALNSAYLLDGVDDWIETNTSFLQTDNPHSISMWWKTTDSTKTNQTLFNTSPHTLENSAFHYSSSSSTPPYGMSFGMGNGLSGVGSWNIMHPDVGQITTPPTLGQWHQYVWVKDASLNWTFYFDGVLINTFNSVTNTGSQIANLRFGAENNGVPTGGANFLGNLDDIGLWDRALTQAEVTALYLGSNVGVNDNYSKVDFSIFPNPTTDKITVKTSYNFYDLPYVIYDQIGRQIVSGKIEKQTTTVDISKLEAGIYFLQINGQNKQTFKIIKN
jgi:hypothetical protein